MVAPKLALPYPGHTWTFTHHAIGLTSNNLYHLLYAAYINAGKTRPREAINHYLADQGILTRNIREGRGEDAWRDYQQIAAELGLIYSTKLVPELKLTTMGIQYIDQSLAYKEVLTAQALKYQYPNGHKNDISTRLRAELESNKIEAPNSLIDLQISKGVLLKPAVLILRLLIELRKIGEEDAISVDECQKVCVPVSRNNQWSLALKSLVDLRKGRISLPEEGMRRNVQDWFSFLAKTSIFEEKTGGESTEIKLSKAFINGPLNMDTLCAEQEAPASFWVPKSTTDGRIGWFDFYGSINLFADYVEPDSSITPEYIRENYVKGHEEGEEENYEDFLSSTPTSISEVPFKSKKASAEKEVKVPDAESIRAGIEKRRERTLLHEIIVREIAEQCSKIGAQVFEDPLSTDLLVRLGDQEVIVEVKTVTRRNFCHRIRLGVGQLLEYQYRRKIQTHTKPDMVLAISTTLPREAWLLDFLTSDLNIGLLCRNGRKYQFCMKNDAIANMLRF